MVIIMTQQLQIRYAWSTTQSEHDASSRRATSVSRTNDVRIALDKSTRLTHRLDDKLTHGCAFFSIGKPHVVRT